jgi:signal transduction histidine kinase
MHASPKIASGESDASRASAYARAVSLAELLEVVLANLRSKTSFERLLVTASYQGAGEARTLGISADDVDSLVEEVERVVRPGATRLTGDVSPASAVVVASSTLANVSTVTVRPVRGFYAGVAVEAEPQHPELATLRETLVEAGPFLHRAAELHKLRSSFSALSRKSRRTRAALDAIHDPVIVLSVDDRVQLANRRAERLLTVSPTDGAGRRRAIETNNLFFSAFRARALLDPPRAGASSELVLVSPLDGSDLLFEVLLSSFDDEGADSSSIYVLKEVTALRHATDELQAQFMRSVAAEHEARRESERLNVVIENAGVPIVVTDAESEVVLMNREAERLFATTEDGPRAGPRLAGVRANNAKLGGIHADFLRQSRLRLRSRLTLVDPGHATAFPALALSTKILDEHYEPTAVVTILRDLTQEVENRRLAQELRELNAQLEERVAVATREIAERNVRLEQQRAALERASRLKSEFLATMSHELRTPINAVLGYNSLLREGIFGPLSEGQGDALIRMRRAAEHLLSIINDILDLSRVEAGKVQVSMSEIDVGTFLEELAESVRPIAEQKSLDFALDLDARTPSIRTDGTRFRQVVLNLLSNAVKFTDVGSITLRAGPLRGGDAVFVEVVDTGVGIDEADWERIFEEFTQVDQSATREHGGAGLGLAISRKLMRVMGGTLRLDSETGRGTTFRIELPVMPPVPWGSAATATRG